MKSASASELKKHYDIPTPNENVATWIWSNSSTRSRTIYRSPYVRLPALPNCCEINMKASWMKRRTHTFASWWMARSGCKHWLETYWIIRVLVRAVKNLNESTAGRSLIWRFET